MSWNAGITVRRRRRRTLGVRLRLRLNKSGVPGFSVTQLASASMSEGWVVRRRSDGAGGACGA